MKSKMKHIVFVVTLLTFRIQAFSQCPIDPGSFTLTSTSIFGTSVSLSWGTSSNANAGYDILFRLSGSGAHFTEASHVGSLVRSGSITGLEYATTYEIQIRALNFCTPSGEAEPVPVTTPTNSNSITITTKPGVPSVQTASNVKTDSFRARWTSVAGASSYELHVSTSPYFTVHSSHTTSSTSRNITGLATGLHYYYKVRAINSGVMSDFSDYMEVYTKPTAPELDPPSLQSQTSFRANWSSVTRADEYRLDISVSNTFTPTSMVSGYDNKPVNGTSETVTNLEEGRTYYYRVRAYDLEGNNISSNSNEQTALTIPANPTSSTATSISQTSFRANWSNVSGETAYMLDVSKSNFFDTDFPAGFPNQLVSGTSSTVSNLEAGQTYYYQVRSLNNSGTSGYSNPSSVLLKPTNPTTPTASNIQSNQFTAQWTANEIPPGRYLVDVSLEENFSSFEHQEISATGTSVEIAALDGGTTYFYRVKAQNSSGESGYSDTAEFLTAPNPPSLAAASDFGLTSFTTNWKAEKTATEYFLDVSDTETFSTLLDGYNDLSTTSTSQSVSGLTPGTVYFYRVRAKNSSGTSNNGIGQTRTVSLPPVAAAPTHISETAFNANWQSAVGAESYLFDLSEQHTFDNFVEGYQQLNVEDGHELLVTSLAPGTQYHYRVKSVNTSGQSSFSSTESLITVPKKTVIAAFTENAATKFKVSWESQKGVNKYEVFVAEDLEFNTPVEGNQPLTVTLTEAFIEGLKSNTIYYVKVRSFNEGGTSEFSEIKTTSTTDSDGSIVFPSIAEVAVNASEKIVSWNISGGTGGIVSVLFRHKKITEKAFTEEVLELSGEHSYNIQIQDDWKDDFGMQYSIFTEDLAGRIDESIVETLQNHHDDIEIVINENFGTDISNYQIISIPYELSTTRIQDLFESVLGSYDNTKWRLLRYVGQDKGYVDYEEGLSVSNVQRGLGYWFISSKEVSLQFGSGEAPSNTLDKPFSLTLQKGWNQIGNPFLEDVSWQAVLDLNNNPETVGHYKSYNPNSSTFEESDILKVYGGGFVFADAEITLSIPVDINLIDTGARIRKSSDNNSNTDLGWELPITLTQGIKVNTQSAIGMNPFATEAKDQLDAMKLPQFGKRLEMYTIHDDFFYSDFSKDIVDPMDQYFWDFQISSEDHTTVALNWEATAIDHGSLILYDIEKNQLINMKEVSSYSLEGGNHAVRIFYAKNFIPTVDKLQLGSAFPNPSTSQMQFRYGFHLGQESSQASLMIYDLSGSEIRHIEQVGHEQGVRAIHWNGKAANGEPVEKGVYLYTIKSSTHGQDQICKGKIVIQ